MKAAIVEKPGRLVVKDVPDPAMGEYDALCEVLYGATCTATDRHIIAGDMPFKIEYPTILGHESIGRVIAVGKRVEHFKEGDLVTRVGAPTCPAAGLFSHWGGFAEIGIARDHWVMRREGRARDEWNVARRNQVLPEDSDPAAATMIITWRETFGYIARMGVTAGVTVLVIGSGGTGLSFVSHARNLGAKRIAVVGNAAREAIARAAGATEFFDYKSDRLTESIRETCRYEFDFIIDSVGKKDSLDFALPLLKPGGCIGVYGMEDYGRCTLNPTKVRGTFTFYQGGYDEEEVHEQVVSLVREAALDASLWMDLEHPFPLADINAAFELLGERKGVKALIQVKR